MSTNLKTKEKIQKAFNDLLGFDSKEDESAFDAQMLSFRVLGEVEKVLAERKITKKKLAEMIGTSASYITQLFQGDKTLNYETSAKIAKALNVRFKISMVSLDYADDISQSEIDFLSTEINKKEAKISYMKPVPQDDWDELYNDVKAKDNYTLQVA